MKKEQYILNALDEINRRLNNLEEKLADRSILSGQWLNQQEVCNELHVTRRTLANYRTKGYLNFTRLGGKILYQCVNFPKNPPSARNKKNAPIHSSNPL